MAAKVAKVAVDLEANSANLQSGLSRADNAMAASGRRWERTLSGMESQISAVGTAIGLYFGIGSITAATSAIISSADAWNRARGGIEGVTGSTSVAINAMEGLYQLALKTGIGIEQSAGAFNRFSIALDPLHATTNEILRMVETLQKVGLVSGASIEETASAIQQLGQGLAKGRLDGDELKSVLENMPLVGRMLAADLKVPIGTLRDLGAEGKLTADKVFGALKRSSKEADEMFSKMPATASRSFDIMAAATGNLAVVIDNTTGATAKISSALKWLTDLLKEAAVGAREWDFAFGNIGKASDEGLNKAKIGLESWIKTLKEAKDTSTVSGVVVSAVPFIDDYIHSREVKLKAINQQIADFDAEASAPPAPAGVTMAQKPEIDKKREGALQKRADTIKKLLEEIQFKEAQLSRSSREQEVYSALERADVSINTEQGKAIAVAAGQLYDKTEAVKELRAEQEAEAADLARQTGARANIAADVKSEIDANAQLVAALNLSEAEYERVSAALVLLNNYRRAGVELSPEEITAARDISDKLVEQRQQIDALHEKYADMQRLGQDAGHAVAGAFKAAIMEGKSLGETLKSLAVDLANLVFQRVVMDPMAKGIGAGLGSIFSGFGFADGGRPPLNQLSTVGERGPELFMPDTAGTIIPNHMLGGGASGANTYIIDARGADAGAVQRIELALVKWAGPGKVETRAVAAVIDARYRNPGMFG